MNTIRRNEKTAVCNMAAAALALVAVLLAALLLTTSGASAGRAYAENGLTAATPSESTYPIVYRLNGGTQAKKQVTEVASGAKVSVTSLKKPKRAGCKFLGWYKNAALTKKATSVEGTASASKRTLYAKWKVNKYPIVFKLNGGKNPSTQTTLVKVGKTLAVSKLKKPKRAGYKFKGWFANKALTKSAEQVQGVAKESKRRVYAKWKLNTYKLTYKVNGGKLSGTYEKTYNVAKKTTLPIPVKHGYAFAGWCTNAKLTKNVGNTTTGLVGNKKLYAKWEPIAYSIAYILDGGTLPSSAPKTYSIESPVKTLPTPTRPGYSFMGWYSNAAKTKLVTSIPATSKGSKKLYADWRERVMVAHRGLRANAVENSVKAFEDAAAKGFREVELDVHFTSDGAPVVVHDDTVAIYPQVNSTAASSVRVDSLAYEQLQTARFAQAVSGTDGKNLATFEETLEACSRKGLAITVHLKQTPLAGVQTALSLAEEYGMLNRVRWFSSDLTALRYIRVADPDAALVYYHSINKQAVKDAHDFASGGDIMICTKYTNVTSSKLALCKNAKLPLGVWGLADETGLSLVDSYVASITVDNIAGSSVPSPLIY